VSVVSRYFNTERIAETVRNGEHRMVIGDMWDEIGTLQFSFLKQHGLEPHHTLLDIGCGSLRGGIHFIDYLDEGNYFGMDLNQSLLDAGYEVELKNLGLQDKLPRDNLLCNGDFEVEQFARTFDFALALSVFTHLPLNHIRVCLEQLAPCVSKEGQFFATYFETPADQPTHEPRRQQPGEVTTYGTRDPYHYRLADFHWLAASQGWDVDAISEFNHPRGQKILKFTRC
jgi:cyclopropane fatty-acyl-phospholipid synthase-like methyltransferase